MPETKVVLFQLRILSFERDMKDRAFELLSDFRTSDTLSRSE